MSPRAYIVTRTVKTGKRYDVRYTIRGRRTHQHWCTETTRRLAERARDYVNGELAVGRYPDPHVFKAPPARRTAATVYQAYIDGHPAPSPSVQKLHRQAQAALELRPLAQLEAEAITHADIQVFVTSLADQYAPATARKYFDQVKAAFAFTDLPRNPCTDPRVRFPLPDDEDDETVDPPDWTEYQLLLQHLPERHQIMAMFIERHGLRGREISGLLVGDLDLRGRTIRVARSRTKGRTGGRRSVPLVGLWAEYLDAIHLPAVELRDMDAVVFPEFNQNTFRGAMARSAKRAKVKACTPHQLRHRYITMLMQARIDPALVAKIAGHRKLSVTQDTYTHVLHGEPLWRLDELRAGGGWVSGLVPVPAFDADVLGGHGSAILHGALA